MALTVRQMKERLARFPPELDDMQMVVSGKVGEGPNWTYEIGPPNWHNDEVVWMPIIRLTRPITQSMIDALEPENRGLLQKMVDSGEWPFDPEA